MKLPDAAWRSQPGLDRLLDALDAPSGATRYVGGAVRDTLLGLPVKDIDLATVFAPEESARRIARAGFKAVPTGIAHGTVTAVLPEGPIEVTTLRRDLATDGRHAAVAFTDDWREDAARRDFTINALFAEPLTGAITDYFEGEADLAAGRVRFIGEPLRRIAEDHLRILRFFRFHARFGQNAPDAASLNACIARANDLMALSRERIADELLKLLAVDRPLDTVATMIANGILAPVLPEIDEAGLHALGRLIDREREPDAFGGPDPVRRLSALLPRDPDAVLAIAQRLRLSKTAQKRLVSAAQRSEADAATPPEALAYALGVENAADRVLLGDGPLGALDRLADWRRPSLGLTGGDLIAMGLQPGPIVAATLQAVERKWIAEGFPGSGRPREIARALVAEAIRNNRPA